VRNLALVLLAACGGSAPDAPADAPDVFLAFSSSFQPYQTWTHFHSEGPPDDGTYSADVLGPREQYISQLPPSGSTAFPVGTMIVEVRHTGVIFAGAKHGGDFNPTGAHDWEWFELLQDPSSQVVSIKWRGVGPPAGEMYGGDPNGGCNACHTACGLNNDYVCSSQLQLASF